ncbi:DNA repair ATPase [Leeuwenhoekiella marinoflava]|uniref:ATPase family protein associated with various cellular activities (AAA) n=2 Tax=Leeuwenhoekiella marinoflava TaxID=988 RepID=A0A4Q0PQ87_9FLAO|nr:DNA repair ATPase [Leeuwenhoekiella marinoflava]RXG32673.1 ATPase family protein associated with various cellular activities (AAA) [Leeuwenhoekiella marinoflava]SHE52931.1 ATPase family associated with various cellular activities (AAA) [Leeuwenhoekiella marinoflava DSM 3653]
MTKKSQTTINNPKENLAQDTLDGGTYAIIRSRLQKQKQDLQDRLSQLNEERKSVFGSLETKLIANDRISTENNCIARDIVSLGNTCIFGYNVHFGLRTEIVLSDVFSIYNFTENRFEPTALDLLDDTTFKTDFSNLYKYYRNTIFSRFAVIGNYLHMVFQLSESVSDIKTFKWLIKENKLEYVDNRSDHEYRFPPQHEFKWQAVSREMHRYGVHSHVSILDRVFVETIGGDLTIKIEDNTEDGKGIFSEPVEHYDQTLDDGQYRYANLGNLIVIDIKPFQEASRYFVYNHKIKQVHKIQSVGVAAVLLPDDQGIIFPNGYYLQTGEYKVFDDGLLDLKFQEKTVSPNGEDFLYVFYEGSKGLYKLMSYNIISQEIKTPIVCSGFTILENGELCYFTAEDNQTKHHVVQIWQTPFLKGDYMPSQHTESMLYKIGNKDIVKAMAESQALITLLNKEDNYDGLYADIAKSAKDIQDSYYWLAEEEAEGLDLPLREINKAANAAIDEFEKVTELRRHAATQTKELREEAEKIFSKIKSSSFKSINDFVVLLTQLRMLRGKVISLRDVRYVNVDFLNELETEIGEQTQKISRRCVQFLLDDKALQPYHDQVAAKYDELEQVKKVIEAKKLEEEVNQIAADLELLIDIVTNLEIEDTAHATKIVDNISLIFATINQLKAALKNKKKALGSAEAQADFSAQLKLIDQSIINYIDIASTPEKCDEFQNKISIQLEELEGKFADFEEFITVILEKREEVYAAFEARKNSLVEKRNKKALALQNASERILKGVSKRAQSLGSADEINGYFASDLMINKLRDIIVQLNELEDSGKAEELETALKVAREDALRKLKDKLDLYEDGEHVIRLGKHKFGVNKQPLDLTIVLKNGELAYHLTGTDFYEKLNHPVLLNSRQIWDQEFVSENDSIYRSAYLAYKIFDASDKQYLHELSDEDLLKKIQELSSSNYSEGYVKGVHDLDAAQILKVLLQKYVDLGLLRFDPKIRAYAQYFWNSLEQEEQHLLDQKLKASGAVLQYFPADKEYEFILNLLFKKITAFNEENQLFDYVDTQEITKYLFDELQNDDSFIRSAVAVDIKESFVKSLKDKQADLKFKNSYESQADYESKIALVKQWVGAFIRNESSLHNELTLAQRSRYIDEVVCLILFEDDSVSKINVGKPSEKIENLKGDHRSLENGSLLFNFHDFITELSHFVAEYVPAFEAFRKAKHEVTETLKEELKLEEFKPKVLTSFVRNKLIDQVYFPLFGDNLAKQLGTVGDTTRTDRMGMLLLISPPGYGKTTLMEYIANRLGLIFMKINGPAIGHEVTSVDPAAATNSASREELKKLNLAFEMGNNVMLYLDDIQHCNPEFLQKFISLSDGTRKIEGVYNEQPKTYDLRGKKFCIIMAGNPYTESGAKFQIPDMLANRADIYNLGDIIGDTADLFKLSLIENSLTANPVLQQLSSSHFDDVYTLLERLETGNNELQLKGNHSNRELEEYTSILEKVLKVRNTILKVNEAYIKSAAMEDAYRTEPAFKLQGSYRDMNKLVAKVVPIMNEKELQILLLAHYESEAQTLTGSAEANLLKYKTLINSISKEEEARWESIKETFVKNNKLKGFGEANEMAQVLAQMMQFSDNLEGIKKVLERGLKS